MKTTSIRALTLIVATLVLVGALVAGQGAWPLRAVAASAPTTPETAPTTVARTITVVGHGTAKTQPNIVKINLGVELVNADLALATATASKSIAAITTALTDLGIAAKDIQPWDYSIWSEQMTQGDGEQAETITLYHLSNMVLVNIRSLEQVAAALNAAVAAGANNISSVNYEVEDMAAVTSQARAQALADAGARAQEVADWMAVDLGAVASVSEVIGAGDFNSGYTMSSPGEVQVAFNIQVSYTIQ